MLVAAWFVRRLMLPYNEQGRYFDEANSVVLDEGAVTLLGLLCLLLATLTAIAAAVALDRRRRG